MFAITDPPTQDDQVLSTPSPVETIVTLVDPVTALFVGSIESNEYLLNVNGDDSVESPTATVDTIDWLANDPLEGLDRSADVETHSDASDEDPPTRVADVLSLVTVFQPTTVTLVTPVDGPLVDTNELIDTPDTVTADVSVPTRDSAVTDAVTPPNTPPLALLTIEESAIHAVASLVLPPMR